MALFIVLISVQMGRSSAAESAKQPAAEPRRSEVKQNPAGTESAALDLIRAQLEALRSDYEKRIKDLEDQLAQLNSKFSQQALAAETAQEPAAQGQPTTVQSIPGALNPAISAIGNIVARADSQKVFNADGERINSNMNLREGEIDMRVPIDPYADGVLITSIASETPGQYSIDLEEAYVNIKKLPFLDRTPLGLKLKVGRFRPAFGKTNILHTHDLPQSFRPLPIEEFMGAEGFNQNGISANFFIPTPWDANSTLDATVEFLGGGTVALSPQQQARNAYLAHLRWFRTLRDAHNFELGASSYYHPTGNGVRAANFNGVDFLYRWKPLRQGEWKSFLLGGEMMFADRAYPNAGEPPEVARLSDELLPGHGKPFGYTVFSQYQIDRRKYAGIRWDQTTTLVNPGLRRRGVTPYFSYYFSEFLRFRLNYEHRWSDFLTENHRNSVFLELNWVFGAHPPEPFWVNK